MVATATNQRRAPGDRLGVAGQGWIAPNDSPRVAGGSRALCERGEFPRPIKIGGVNLWVREEVEQFLDERKRERSGVNAKRAAVVAVRCGCAARVGLLAGAAPR